MQFLHLITILTTLAAAAPLPAFNLKSLNPTGWLPSTWKPWQKRVTVAAGVSAVSAAGVGTVLAIRNHKMKHADEPFENSRVTS